MDGLSMIAPKAQMALMQAHQVDPSQAAQNLKSVPPNMEQIEAAAQDFEAMFLAEMIRPMFEELQPNEMFGGGKAEEIFQGLMLEEYGKIMAQSGGVGLAKYVRAEMIRMQEEAQQQ
ncbi:MAG: rod-binding protein [Proteobacteria bacterium]|nr:rod-binding protein [Pseudomonadota bacterium]